ncbi:MAG: hypothetical protein UW06_C0055G0007 [Parcubacteria group bacterium GW2011_GWE1_43_8]|nr:MAG: hypothetical protein UW06_C0055G0007 [Parcubacteria group bacterium GW2011_GWE1_43_8]
MKYLDIFNFSKYSFDGIKSYENVILYLNRHWFVMFGKFLAFGLLLIVPFVIYAVFGEAIVSMGIDNLFWLIVSIYFLFWWNSLFYAITMYLLDSWIVIDHRIIDSEQKGFFSRTVSELSLSRIQDISTHIVGPLTTILDFGDLEIQTAGAEPKFVFKEIPGPNAVKSKIMVAHNEFVSMHKGDVEVHEGIGKGLM